MQPFSKWNVLRLATVAAAAVAIAAAFMPWVKADVLIFSVTVNGMERDGLFTALMGAGVIAAVLAAVYTPLSSRRASTAVAIFGAGIALIGFLTWIDISGAVDVDGTELESLPGIDVSVQIGLVLTMVSGVAAAALGLVAVRLDDPPPEPTR